MQLIKEVKVMTVRETADNSDKLITAENVASLWKSCISTSNWYDTEKEAFIVILLNKRFNVKGYNLVSLGTNDSSLVHAREVFRPAIVAAASCIIIAHNHPTGDTTPSANDLRITRQLIEAGMILGIEVLDSVIVGDFPDSRTCSIRESGLINFA